MILVKQPRDILPFEYRDLYDINSEWEILLNDVVEDRYPDIDFVLARPKGSILETIPIPLECLKPKQR
jgi:hypothetical protein